MSNKNSKGGAWTQAEIDAVWQKGQIAIGYNPNQTRKDVCGALIDYSEHGKTSKRGWEVDHIKPVAKGGGDELPNLQPLQWENNRYKGDNWPQWDCLIKS